MIVLPPLCESPISFCTACVNSWFKLLKNVVESGYFFVGNAMIFRGNVTGRIVRSLYMTCSAKTQRQSQGQGAARSAFGVMPKTSPSAGSSAGPSVG